MPHPKCFTAQQYASWLELAESRWLGGEDYPGGYCTDCTPAYRERMKAAGRCDQKRVQFYKNLRLHVSNRGIVGRFPRESLAV
jgi:hypothetical protein